MRALPLFAALLWLAYPAPAEEPVDYRKRGDDHYFNLEHDEALVAYYQVIEGEGESARLWTRIATTFLYRELNRLGLLETSAFKAENEFLEWEKPDPDPQARAHFFGAVGQAKRLAESKLADDPDDPDSLLALSNSYALEANYEFMVEKAYLSALGKGKLARKYSDQVYATHPGIVDALLVSGVQEYVIGSLPWAVRTLVSIGGIRGNKEKGQRMVERVAAEGDILQNEARVLLTVLHRREGRPLEAARILRRLNREFPRNYVLQLELAAMHLEAGEKAEALEIFRRTRRMVERDEQRFGRMPERLQKALDLKIEALEQGGVETAAMRR
jgi:tetratricopeptide (TPR) repeat protein